MPTTFLSRLADQLILHPTRHVIDETSARPMLVPGPSGDLEIYVASIPGVIGREPDAFVLTFTGNASRAEWDAEDVAELWGDRPVEVWGLNYPGYGKSDGPASLTSIAPAALAAFDALQTHAQGRPIFVGGRSIGTTAALYVAAHRPVGGVILHSPVNLRNLIMSRFGWWNLWLGALLISSAVPADLDSIANAKHATASGVFIVTEADLLVPASHQKKIADAYGGPKDLIVIANLDHNDPIPESAMGRVHAAMDNLLRQNAR